MVGPYSVDMLNFKAYIQCFPAIFGMYRIGDVDYIHFNHKRDDSTVGVVNFMTMYQLDAIFRRAVWDAYKINSENPYAHIAFFFSQHAASFQAQLSSNSCRHHRCTD